MSSQKQERGYRVTDPDGFVCIDKQPGLTSFDVVRLARRCFGTRRVGHAGTLDPMATGLLVVCVGWSTRLVPYLTADAKVYEGELLFGIRTTTDDAEGEPLETRCAAHVDSAGVQEAFRAFHGTLEQTPPQVSAVHVDGERAYARVRAGEQVEIPARTVTVHSLDITEMSLPRVRFTAHVSKGTYIRSLARDMGEKLGCGAHLTALRRTRSGGHRVDGALTMDDLRSLSSDQARDAIGAPWDALCGMPSVTLEDAEYAEVRHGRRIQLPPRLDVAPDTLLRVQRQDGRFVGVLRSARCEDGAMELRPERIHPYIATNG